MLVPIRCSFLLEPRPQRNASRGFKADLPAVPDWQWSYMCYYSRVLEYNSLTTQIAGPEYGVKPLEQNLTGKFK